jgi:hypothetical protein
MDKLEPTGQNHGRYFNQGILTKREGSVHLTSFLLTSLDSFHSETIFFLFSLSAYRNEVLSHHHRYGFPVRMFLVLNVYALETETTGKHKLATLSKG